MAWDARDSSMSQPAGLDYRQTRGSLMDGTARFTHTRPTSIAGEVARGPALQAMHGDLD